MLHLNGVPVEQFFDVDFGVFHNLPLDVSKLRGSGVHISYWKSQGDSPP